MMWIGIIGLQNNSYQQVLFSIPIEPRWGDFESKLIIGAHIILYPNDTIYSSCWLLEPSVDSSHTHGGSGKDKEIDYSS